MILNEITPVKALFLKGWELMTENLVIDLPRDKSTVDFCVCSVMCNYSENAWVYPTDSTDEYKNDYRAILITLLDVASTYTFKLVKGSVKTTLVDVTHGELFPIGFVNEQPLKVGFKIDWLKVYNTLGAGSYQIEVTQTDFGNTVTSTSHDFNVRVFDAQASNFSVKIETVQTGIILNGENYSGMSWANMVRVKGTFGNMAPNYEINRLVDANRKDIDVQVSKHNKYTLKTELLPDYIGELITDDTVLTDNIFISVNDIFNYSQYRRLEVTFEGSLEAGEDYSKNNRKLFNVTFKDRTLKLKRNFV